MSKIFISHSSNDKDFAIILATDLKKLGHTVWFDEWSIGVGDCIITKIEEGISRSDYLIIVLSRNSVKSNWVEKEWKIKFWDEIRENKVKVLPALIQRCSIPPMLKSKKYANFIHDYKVGLQELVRSIDSNTKNKYRKILNRSPIGDSFKIPEQCDFIVSTDYGKNKNQIKALNPEVGIKYMNKDLEGYIDNRRVANNIIAVLMVDIDDLTLINKRFSREVGDFVIYNTLRILNSFNQIKIAGRCGDDTYYAILIGVGVDFAFQIAEKIRISVCRSTWEKLASELYVTCSIGCAELHKDEPIRDWLVRACIGMNEAKKKGKDRVERGPRYISKSQSREVCSYFS